MMKLLALFFAVVLSTAMVVVAINTLPSALVILICLVGMILLACWSLIGLSLRLQAKIAVAKIEAGRPILPPAKAAPVVVMPARFVLDPAEDARRRLAQGAGEEAGGYVPDPGNQPPARRPRQWRVVNG